MRLAAAIALIFVSRFAVTAWFDPARDGDIAWQQWLGLQILQTRHLPSALGPETFTAAGAPWVPQEWALSVAVALTLGKPAFIGLVALTVLASALAMFFTALASRRLGASTVATAVAVFCVAVSMLEPYGIRAQVFGWAVLAAIVYVLRCMPGRGKWWIAPLVAVWANVHASAMIAPALLALWTAGMAVQERGWTAQVRQYALLTLACAGAVFLTPLGYRLPLYAFELMRSPIRSAISEWQPARLTEPSFTFGALVLIVAVCVFRVERSRRWPELFVIAAVSYLSITALRNAPICAIVLAPAVAQRLTAYLPERLRINSVFAERPVAVVVCSCAACAALLMVFVVARSPELQKKPLPAAAVAALASMPGSHRLYCEDFAWCSLALRYPNLREFIDGRCDPFPIGVWHDYLTIIATKAHWRTVLDRRSVNAVLAANNRRLARALPLWRGWHLVYKDAHYRLFVRSGGSGGAHKD